MVFAILVLDELKPLDGYSCHLSEVLVDAFYLGFHPCNEFVGLVLVEFQDALHLYFHKAQDVFFAHFTNELGVERR